MKTRSCISGDTWHGIPEPTRDESTRFLSPLSSFKGQFANCRLAATLASQDECVYTYWWPTIEQTRVRSRGPRTEPRERAPHGQAGPTSSLYIYDDCRQRASRNRHILLSPVLRRTCRHLLGVLRPGLWDWRQGLGRETMQRTSGKRGSSCGKPVVDR